MPTLDIREGAIELLMRTYKGMLPELGGYLAHGSTLNLNRIEKFIQVLEVHNSFFGKEVYPSYGGT
jgi:5'-3' exoribonuclease 2